MRRVFVVALVPATALAVPAAAWAHAGLLKTFPTASTEVDKPPGALAFDVVVVDHARG